LLEVMLALALLGGALAVLGELVRQATTAAAEADDLTTAQTLCASRLAEALSGMIPLQSVQGAPCEEDPAWVYALELQATGQAGVALLRVTVSQVDDSNGPRTEFSLVRLVQDPSVNLAPEDATGDTSAGQSSSSGSSSSATGTSTSSQ
jgi:type II secretory pathway pseudopilin PulG